MYVFLFCRFLLTHFCFFKQISIFILVENKTWKEIKETIASNNETKTAKYWLNQVSFSKFENMVFHFSVPSVFVKDSFEKKFGKALEKELALRGMCKKYQLTVDEDLLKKNLSKTQEQKNSFLNKDDGSKNKEKLEETYNLTPFDNFYTGSSNNLAVVAAKAVAKNPGKRFNPLFIYGRPGVGKTHLLKTLKETRVNSLYIGSEDFLNSFVKSIKDRETALFKDRVRNNEILLLDDLQFLAGKKAVSEEVLHTVNHYIEKEKAVVLVSDVRPEDLFGFPERLISRIYSGLVTDIEKPNEELLLKYLENKIDSSLFGKGVVERITSLPFDNFRELEGFLNKFSLNVDAGVDAGVFVEDFIRNKELVLIKKKTPEDLLFFVSKKYQVDKELLLSKNRTEKVCNARHVLIGLLRKHTDLSLQQIGLYVGNRSHSTILSSLKKINSGEGLFIKEPDILDIEGKESQAS